MQISPATQRTIDALRDLTARHRRKATLVWESDPWEEPDPWDPASHEAEFLVHGRPRVEIRLYRTGGEDVVEVEGSVRFDVSRDDVIPFVDAILRGNVTMHASIGSAEIRVHLPADKTYQEIAMWPWATSWFDTLREG